MKTTAPVLDRLLDPVAKSFTPRMARALVDLRADEEAQARVEELAEKCNEGSMTSAERDEYESYVHTINVIAVLQSKARVYLARLRKRR